MMSGGLVDKVYIGLDNAPAAFDIKGRILGPVSNRTFVVFFYILKRIESHLINFVSEWYQLRIH